MEILFWFQHSDFDLIEIKRLNLGDEKDPSKIYQWLILTKHQIIKLNFLEMGVDFRKFKYAHLEFKSDFGEFSIGNKKYNLKKMKPEKNNELLLKIQQKLQPININDEISFSSINLIDLSVFKVWINDPEVIRYSMTKFRQMKTEAECENWFFSTLLDLKTFQFAIWAKDKIIGYAGIAGINEIDMNGEFFILIGEKNYWGKGIATLVAKEILKLGFNHLNLHRIFLTASSDNPGALKAYERAGFILEGVMKEAFFRNNKFSDKVIMGKLNND